MKNNKIELKNDSIMLNDIFIDDLNTYKILKDIKEENREDFIKKAIIIGAIGLRNLYLTENVDYIEKEFKEVLKGLESQSKDIKNNLEKEFRDLLKSSEDQSKDIKNMIEKTLDVDSNSSSLGKMRILFEDYFDKRKGKISDLLSPFEEGSPIKKLKEEIFKKIQDLRDELIKEKTKEELIEKTTLKGGNFEEIAIETVEDFCSEYEDKVSPVGEISGKRNKIGDIIIDINGDENKRIVIECKDSSAYSYKKTIDEIHDAIENRNAKFGIFLFKSQSQIPSALTPVKITNNYIVTSFDQGIYFAIRVARLFVERSMESRQKEIPIDEIQKEVEKIMIKLSDFKSIHTKLTQIDNASDYIRKNIDRLKKDIEEGLSSVKELLNGH
ncbi:MAG: hypothetical protein KJ600_03580 [Nanoarchaeota archaeon]|nr:hypothetical protein [Nanoarchaeota archaeon]MBU1103609.1 hypothetical protein [Nanoarchaeota archaeon]